MACPTGITRFDQREPRVLSISAAGQSSVADGEAERARLSDRDSIPQTISRGCGYRVATGIVERLVAAVLEAVEERANDVSRGRRLAEAWVDDAGHPDGQNVCGN